MVYFNIANIELSKI